MRDLASIFFTAPIDWLIKNTNVFFGFSISLIIIFTFYFLIFYSGKSKKIFEDWKQMPKNNKKSFIIFLLGGILVAFIFYYVASISILNKSLPEFMSFTAELFENFLFKIKILE